MDWLITAGIVVAGWTMLSVLTGERLNRSQQIAALKAHTAAEKARQAAEVPIAVASEAVRSAIPAGQTKSARPAGAAGK